MAVDQKEAGLEDEELELQKIHAVMESRHRFGRSSQEPAFYVGCKTWRYKDAARKAFWPLSSQLCRRQPFFPRVSFLVLEPLGDPQHRHWSRHGP